MAGGKGNIKPEDGKQFSKEYQPKEKWTESVALKLGEELIAWLKEKTDDGQDKCNIFFEEFLIIENDYYPSLITYLCDKFSSFSDLIAKAKKIQEIKLQKYGVADSLNATMTKFVLTNQHGWTDKVDNTTNGKEITKETPTIVFMKQDDIKN